MNDQTMHNMPSIHEGSCPRPITDRLIESLSCTQAMEQLAYSNAPRIDAMAVTPATTNARTNTRAIAVGQWLHTPKFGTFGHSQRWRFAT